MRHKLWFVRDPIAAHQDLQRKYGNVFRFRTMGAFGDAVVIAEPDIVQDIFVALRDRFETGAGHLITLSPVMGSDAIFTLDGERHARSRKLALPPLHGSRIKGYGDTIREVVEQEVDGWPVGEPFLLAESLRTMAIDIFLRVMLGLDDPDMRERIRTAANETIDAANTPVTWSPAMRRDLGRFSPWGRFVRKRAVLHAAVEEVMESRRRDPNLEQLDDYLSTLLVARDEDGQQLSHIELRSELMSVLAAGTFTTIATTSWLFDQVLRRPDIEGRLRDELAQGEDEYLRATIHEALRWGSVIFGFPRRAKEEMELGGWRIRKGQFIMCGLALIHHRADLWPEPDAFKPERFLDGPPDTKKFIPWGGGDRRCIGASFAMLEMTIMVRTILERARLSLTDPRPDRRELRSVAIVPSRGVEVRVDERLPAAAETRAVAAV